MSSYANIAETTALQSFRQDGASRRRSWLQIWIDARRVKAAQRRLAEDLRYMDHAQLVDIGIVPASLSATTVRLAQLNPPALSCSFMFSLSRR